MSLKKPYAKYKQSKDLERAFARVDFKTLAINRRWPQPIQDIIKRGLARDLWARPVMSDICKVLNECTSKDLKLALPKPCSYEDLQKLRSSFRSASSIQKRKNTRHHSSWTSGTTADTNYEELLLKTLRSGNKVCTIQASKNNVASGPTSSFQVDVDTCLLTVGSRQKDE